jgi:hypothetical protein
MVRKIFPVQQLILLFIGTMKTSPGISDPALTNRTYLPLSNDTCNNAKSFGSKNANYYCFLAGDHRASQNLGLSSLHTLFLREHNRIAETLAALKPTWNDEKIFYETRRIIIAQIQNIVFNDWLPIATNNIALKPLSATSYYTGYDSTVRYK